MTRRARLSCRLREERGEVTIKGIVFVLLLIVVYKVYPDLFTGFFSYVHDHLFQGINNVQQHKQQPGVLPLPHTGVTATTATTAGQAAGTSGGTASGAVNPQNASGAGSATHHVTQTAQALLERLRQHQPH